MLKSLLKYLGLQKIKLPTEQDIMLAKHARRRKEIKKLREEGLTLQAIADIYNITKQRVWQITLEE